MFLGLHAAETYSFSVKGVLCSLKSFYLEMSSIINQDILTLFLDKFPNIEELTLRGGNFSNFNLDHLVNLKTLRLNGTINDDFNFGLFKNLCNQLEELSISFRGDYESIASKLFDDHRFPNLLEFNLFKCNVIRLKHKFVEKFPALLKLTMHDCDLETIEDDAFSNTKNLTYLSLMGNFFKTLDKRIFSPLINLEELYLRNNRTESIEKDMFSHMKKLRVLNLNVNNFSDQFYYEIFCYYKNLELFFPTMN